MRGAGACPDGDMGFGFGSLARAPPVSDPMPSGRRVVPGQITITRYGRLVAVGRPAPPNPSFPDAFRFYAIQHAGLPAADTGQRGRRHRRGCLRTGARRDVDLQSFLARAVRSRTAGSTVLRRSGVRGPETSDLAKGVGSVARLGGVGKRSRWDSGKCLESLAAGARFVHVVALAAAL